MLRMSMRVQFQKILALRCDFEGKKLDAYEYEASDSENTCFEM